MITALPTPPVTASIAVPSFGIIPPEAVPSSHNFCASAVLSERMSCFCPSSTPGTSVSSRSVDALRALATTPAIVSAFTLYEAPPSPVATGAMTGMMPPSSSCSSSGVRTVCGAPTSPRSTSTSLPLCASTIECPFFDATTRESSLPERPTARPPAALIDAAIFLLSTPHSTISTTSIVAASVTRSPSTNSEWIFSRSSIAPICGPPPCTTTGRIPIDCSTAMSAANSAARASLVMA
mmetsp:Transcript_10375/g.25766  ORF Transcript_10375/g.25766 Transcript_10375/m.25766 type:complete len:237 (-) Transcript_10375:327-1037(-)